MKNRTVSWIVAGLALTMTTIFVAGCAYDRGCSDGSCAAPSNAGPSYASPSYNGSGTSEPYYNQPSGSGTR